MAFELKPLTFPKDALGPTMSTSTLEHHHEKHHAGYVKKLNELIAGSKFEKSDLESIVRALIGTNTALAMDAPKIAHIVSSRFGRYTATRSERLSPSAQ
jgi:Fe-Mn family superoxide dismutase